jgi:hypothetical protein
MVVVITNGMGVAKHWNRVSSTPTVEENDRQLDLKPHVLTHAHE